MIIQNFANMVCFEAKKIVLKNLQWIELCKFTKKKTLVAAFGVDSSGFYRLLFFRFAKARFLSKEFVEILSITEKISLETGINFKKKSIYYTSEICSKTINLMKENGFKNDSM